MSQASATQGPRMLMVESALRSGPSTVGVTADGNTLCCQPLQHSFPSHSFFPRAQPAATLFVLQKSCLCGKTLCQFSWTMAKAHGHCRLSAPEHPHSLLGEWFSHAETGLCAKEVLGGRSVAAVHSRHTTVFLPGCPESRDRCPQ